MGIFRKIAVLTALIALGGTLSGVAGAAQPEPWQLGMQPAASPIAEQIHQFHNWLLILITAITVFVLALLVYVMMRFSEGRNPTPSKTTHNTLIEVIWTAVPVVILVTIAIPSFRLLYAEDVIPESDMTLKAIGHQWYWSYEYPDHGNFTFDANPIADDELQPGQPRLLATDYAVVLPVDTKIRILVTASDVLHNFTVPAMGFKIDAVPGRINETWVEITREGTYYGQCSELCGTAHSYMPIMVKAVSKDAFAKWVETAQKEFARRDDGDGSEASVRLAATAE